MNAAGTIPFDGCALAVIGGAPTVAGTGRIRIFRQPGTGILALEGRSAPAACQPLGGHGGGNAGVPRPLRHRWPWPAATGRRHIDNGMRATRATRSRNLNPKAKEKAESAQDWRSEVESGDHAPIHLARSGAREEGRGREATTPSEIPARGWRDILVRVVWALPEDRVLSTAGGVAFFALLSVFPALATVVSLYGLFSDAASIPGHLALLDGLVPDGVLLLVAQELTRVASQRTDALGFAFTTGLAIALWSANSGVAALFDALNVVYREREKRSLLRFYATTFLFTLGGIVFMLSAVGAVVVLPVALGLLGMATQAERVVSILRWPLLLLAIMAALALVYRFGPSRRLAKWRWVSWGSAVAALLWIAASMLFSWYVASFDSYNRVYGSLGAGIGFVTWIWISAVIVLAGAELNAEMEHQTAMDTTRGRPKPLGIRGAVVADTVGEAQD